MGVRLCECGCGQVTKLARGTDGRKGIVKGQPLRFIHGHHQRKSPVDYLVDPETGCWVWQLARFTNGYGRINRGDGAHRIYYERFKGPIPARLHIDHLCRNRACVNPDHMEAVTPGENAARGHRILTWEQVREIRRRFAEGATERGVAAEYGVSRWCVKDIKNGRNWREVAT